MFMFFVDAFSYFFEIKIFSLIHIVVIFANKNHGLNIAYFETRISYVTFT